MKKALIFLLLISIKISAQVPDKKDHFKVAQELFEQKKYNECIIEYSNFLTLHPNDAAAYYHRGLAKYILEDYKDAMSDYGASIQNGRDLYDVYYDRGLCEFFVFQYDEALRDFDRSIAMNKEYAPAHTYKAATLLYLEKYNEAVPVINKAIELDGKFDWSYYYRSKIKFSIGDLKGSLDDINKCMILKQRTQYYLQRGYVLLESKKYNESMPDFDSVIYHNPKDADAYYNRGVAHLCLTQYQKALDDFNKSIETDPTKWDCYNARGLAKFFLKKYKEAIPDFNAVIDLTFKESKILSSVYYHRGLCKIEVGQKDDACGDLKKAQQMEYTKAADKLKELGCK